MYKYRVSFTGDIMCEKPLLKHSKKNRDYSFEEVFKGLQGVFKDSDHVVANLETIFAGEDQGYTTELFSFNSPDSFLQAVKNAGVTVVTTANNHVLDRGVLGLERTLEKVEELGIKNIGTFKDNKRDPFEVLEFDGLKIGLIAYTYGTNTSDNKLILGKEDEYRINMLKNQKKELENFNSTLKSETLRGKVSKVIRKFTTFEQRFRFKKMLGMNVSRVYQDHLDESDLNGPYLEQLRNDIETAKKDTDIVIVVLHSGGQFNRKVGSYTEKIVEYISECGADIVVGHHPHVIQRLEKVNDTDVFFSLGNLSISPSSVYLPSVNLPEYGIVLHIDFNNARDFSYKFSIVKMIEKEKGDLRVFNVSDLKDSLNEEDHKQLEKDVLECYNTFTKNERKELAIQEEYEINTIIK